MNLKLTAIIAAWLCLAATVTQAQTDSSSLKRDGSPARDTLPLPDSLHPKTLKAATITAHRPAIEQLIDRTVVNAEALPGKDGATLMDLLERSPGVTVEQNKIQLQGKDGVTIYIDDKPTYLSGDDLVNYLRSLPASAVDRIELMTNPPAKYDAAGNGGVINIRLKRIREKGFNGNVNGNYIQGKYARSNDGLNLNIRQNKWNVAANFGYIRNNNFNDIDLSRYFDPAVITGIAPVFTQGSYVTRHFNNYSGRISIDDYLTDKTTVGMTVSGLMTQGHTLTANRSYLSSQQNQLDSTILANNTERRRFRNGAVNLNYRHDYDKKGSGLSADLDYVVYRTRLDQTFANQSFYPDGTLYDQTLQTGNIPAHVDIYSAKTDYTRVLANGLRLSTGVKSSYTKTDNIADYFDITNGVSAPDYDETNHFLYSENINAVYVNGAEDFRRFSFQAGLRFENTNANGHQLGNAEKPDSSFNRGYNSLFPTFYVQYKLDSATRQTIGFNIGRRISRPNYNSLNPFLSPMDKFTYNAGNPFLLPAYSTNYQLYYTWKRITATLYYNYTYDREDGLVQIINGIYYSRPGNIGNSYNRGIELNADLDPTKWLNLHLYAEYRTLHTVTNFYTGPLNTTGEQLVLRPTLTVKPGEGWTLQAWGGYQSRFTNEQFIDAPRGSLNFDFEKKLSSGWTVEIDTYDVLHTQNNAWQIGYLQGTTANFHSVGDSRNVQLTVTYRFGKTINDQRNHNANGAQSEMNRVGN